MIQLTNLGSTVYWIRPESILSIETLPEDGDATWIHLSSSIGYKVDQTPEQILALMNPPAAKPSAPLDDLHMVLVTDVQRAETSNSASPMWRCSTDDDNIRFNIFQHTDPDKNNYALFAAAGWSDLLDRIPLYDSHDLTEFGLIVALKRDGKWWSVVKVRPLKAAASAAEMVAF